MVNKPKMEGTAAESAVVNWLRDNGHPHVERRPLRGGEDWGDVTGIPGVCIEVKKSGKILKLAQWLRETEQERVNSRSGHGILVVKPSGYGVTRTGDWWAVMYNWDWLQLCKEADSTGVDTIYNLPGNHTLYDLPGNHITRLGEAMKSFAAAFIEEVPSSYGGSLKGVNILIHTKGEQDPQWWYRVTTLRKVNDLLLEAGYGTLNR